MSPWLDWLTGISGVTSGTQMLNLYGSIVVVDRPHLPFRKVLLQPTISVELRGGLDPWVEMSPAVVCGRYHHGAVIHVCGAFGERGNAFNHRRPRSEHLGEHCAAARVSLGDAADWPDPIGRVPLDHAGAGGLPRNLE